MRITTFDSAAHFLKSVQGHLEINEVCNSLILGICQRLALHPESTTSPPCFKAVEDGETLAIAAMMTPPHNIVMNALIENVESAAQFLADDVNSEGWEVPGALGPGAAPRIFAARWAELTNQHHILKSTLRVYTLQKVMYSITNKGTLRRANSDDKAVVVNWWYAFGEEIHEKADRNRVEKAAQNAISNGDLFVWDVGHPVSMAMKTRPTRRNISITAVYTPPEFRGKGYATACVGALSQHLLKEGWQFCSLFADLANPISNRVYQKIGYKPVCDYFEYVFE